ncbi:hypothetical protein DMR_00920 [Solidesulfovibrio magneticus RS-1]|uniref:Uncharacterized protein n=1 Tax=Solidesulfovibrio magneticus (strain ATCC 700980 / DSM 13731 / RS-1) TaxID=573370 RepID=C4XTR8_SOLM1|nr:hypothetical protein DMR_00920 [Solidesulfovibrio magneticus RS-1]
MAGLLALPPKNDHISVGYSQKEALAANYLTRKSNDFSYICGMAFKRSWVRFPPAPPRRMPRGYREIGDPFFFA